MSIIAWVILGLLAGAIAKAIYPGRQGGGLLSTMVLGVVGAFLGGTLHVFTNCREPVVKKTCKVPPRNAPTTPNTIVDNSPPPCLPG